MAPRAPSRAGKTPRSPGDYGRPLGVNPGVATVPSGPTENAARDAIFAEKLANGASNTDYKLIDVEMVKWLPRS